MGPKQGPFVYKTKQRSLLGWIFLQTILQIPHPPRSNHFTLSMKTTLLAMISTLAASATAVTTNTFLPPTILTENVNAYITYGVSPLYGVTSPQGTTFNVPITQ